MGGETDTINLARLGLSSGEGIAKHVRVSLDPVDLGGQRYSAEGAGADVRLDLSRTTNGYALRLRFEAPLEGPCMRCLEGARPTFSIDAREVDQPAEADDDVDDLTSPYVDGDELDLRAWTRDALVLGLPNQIVCRQDCRGLCGVCGLNLNENPEHVHEQEPDARWAKLSELKFD